MEPKIKLTSPNGWESDYLRKLLEGFERLGLGTPIIKTGMTWLGNYRLEVTFKSSTEK